MSPAYAPRTPGDDRAAPPVRRPRLDEAHDAYEQTVISFSTARRRAAAEGESPDREGEREQQPVAVPGWREREGREPARSERAAGAQPRRTARRRRRSEASWLQRNAMGVAGLSVLAALLGMGFGLMQMLGRAEVPTAAQAAPARTADALPPAPGATASSNLAMGPVVDGGGSGQAPQGPTAPREVTASARALEASYTVQQGDTLGAIARRFNTTVERLQALNNLADPRLLSIGQKLVIPPPF